jgi:hypothetical protein
MSCSEIDKVYSERNRLAVAFCKMAVNAGWKAGRRAHVGEEDWDDEWKTVIAVELPNGKQVSWHISDREHVLALQLPEVDLPWDGTNIAKQVDWTDNITVRDKQ